MCRSKRIETLATKIGDNANVIFDSKKHFKHFIINQTYLYKIFVAYEYNRYYRIRCEEYKLEFLCRTSDWNGTHHSLLEEQRSSSIKSCKWNIYSSNKRYWKVCETVGSLPEPGKFLTAKNRQERAENCQEKAVRNSSTEDKLFLTDGRQETFPDGNSWRLQVDQPNRCPDSQPTRIPTRIISRQECLYMSDVTITIRKKTTWICFLIPDTDLHRNSGIICQDESHDHSFYSINAFNTLYIILVYVLAITVTNLLTF